MNNDISFSDLNRQLVISSASLLREWLPGGELKGNEYEALNPTRQDSSPGSFRVNVHSGKWSDFATDDKGGDLISLYAYLEGISQSEAARRLAERLGLEVSHGANGEDDRVSRVPEWSQVMPVPQEAPLPPVHSSMGKPSQAWSYRDEDGNLLCYTCRFDMAEGKKEVRPLTYWENSATGEQQWRWKGFDGLRPLYGLEKLKPRPEDTVIVAEGEKATDAAQKLFPDYAAITSTSGSNAAHKSDWTPLKGRSVIIAPDNDEPGAKYFEKVRDLLFELGVGSVHLLEWPKDKTIQQGEIVDRDEALPKGWDLADALAEGWTPELIQQLQDNGVSLYSECTRPSEPEVTAVHTGSLEGIPARFRLDESGVYYADPNNEHEIRVCSPLEIMALTRDTLSTNWGRLINLTDPDGQAHQWAMPSKLLGSIGNSYLEELLSLGLDIEPGNGVRKALHKYLSSSRPTDRARCVHRIGWHDGIYVLPDTIFGDDGGDRTILQTPTVRENTFRTQGSVEDWAQEIGSLCIGNSRMLFAVSAAFAAPLLYLADGESGGFHFRGASSTGKTTLLRIAGSVWGGGGVRGYLNNWRATDNGIEGVALNHCDALLCLDELSQVDGRKAGQIAYMLANGVGKARASKDGSGRAPAEWRILLLSTGEIALADKMSESGERVSAGQQVRVVDIPVEVRGGYGAFENLHDQRNGDAFARHLNDMTGKYYGSPIRTFLQALTSGSEDVKHKLLRLKRQVAVDCVAENADGQVKRVAARFGLVAAAGEIASELGILPWPEGAAIDAAKTCFRDWLDARGSTEPSEITAGIAQIRLFLERYGDSRFTFIEDTYGQDSVRERAGYKMHNDGRTDYLIFTEVFKNDVISGFDKKLICNALIDKGLLITKGDGRPASQHRIPGCSSRRLYHISGDIFEGGQEDASDA